jgi:hypothetical protein
VNGNSHAGADVVAEFKVGGSSLTKTLSESVGEPIGAVSVEK